MIIEQRGLLLVPFPFSDQTGKKVRPVVVISNNTFNQHSEDILVAAVTSNVTKDNYTPILNPQDVEEGTLHHTCCIKVESMLKLDKRLVIKKIGKIKPSLFQINILDSILK